MGWMTGDGSWLSQMPRTTNEEKAKSASKYLSKWVELTGRSQLTQSDIRVVETKIFIKSLAWGFGFDIHGDTYGLPDNPKLYIRHKEFNVYAPGTEDELIQIYEDSKNCPIFLVPKSFLLYPLRGEMKELLKRYPNHNYIHEA